MDNKKGIIIVVVLFVAAALLFGRYFWQQHQENRLYGSPTRADIEAQIKRIEADTHMPQYAKDAQIGMLRAHMPGGGGSRGPSIPTPPGQ